jgi:hypothetical protein
LREIRLIPGLDERSRGVFYRKSRAFLHFHEDPSGIHGDVRIDAEFERHRAETATEQLALLELIRSAAN